MTEILIKKLIIPRGIISAVQKELDFSDTAIGIALGAYTSAPNSVSETNTKIITDKAVEIAKKRIEELQEFIDSFSHSV